MRNLKNLTGIVIFVLIPIFIIVLTILTANNL